MTLYIPKFKKSKVLIKVDLASQDWVSFSLSQTTEMHLLVEEIHHFLFRNAERNVSNV